MLLSRKAWTLGENNSYNPIKMRMCAEYVGTSGYLWWILLCVVSLSFIFAVLLWLHFLSPDCGRFWWLCLGSTNTFMKAFIAMFYTPFFYGREILL